MRIKKPSSAEDHKLISSFQAVRTTLLKDKYESRRNKPLAYWALTNDRRLPLALLGKTIDDLLATPFEELSATPGIGQKKISTLVQLLHRAVSDEPSVPFGFEELAPHRAETAADAETGGVEPFDAAAVSESLWAKWRETVRRHRLADLPLGRLAPTLQQLPTVIWQKPLGDYLDLTVAEIRGLKTHGEKRVRVVLEVFYLVHCVLAEARVLDHLQVYLLPRFAVPIHAWTQAALGRSAPPDLASVRKQIAQPMLEQVKADAGETVYALAAGRLGVPGKSDSVRTQAQELGVTRARVYQLLENCGEVMAVRWPEGRAVLEALAQRLDGSRADGRAQELLAATRELFFPDKAGTEDNGRP